MQNYELIGIFSILSVASATWHPTATFIETATNVTIREGSHAFLPCRVKNLGDRSITWIRKEKLHIITAGMLTYSPDDRYRVLHPTNSDEWTLHIKFAQKADAGWYECQVNSDPKQTRPVLLIVRDRNMDDPFYQHEEDSKFNSSLVQMEGPEVRFMNRGSVLAITCVVWHTRNVDPDLVTWYHGGTKLDYDSPRGGIALQTEKTKERTVSKLMLSAVTPSDSGRYTCDPDAGGSTSITVHVQEGQHQAAVQQSGYNSSKNRQISFQIILIISSLFHAFFTFNAG